MMSALFFTGFCRTLEGIGDRTGKLTGGGPSIELSDCLSSDVVAPSDRDRIEPTGSAVSPEG